MDIIMTIKKHSNPQKYNFILYIRISIIILVLSILGTKCI